MKEKNKKSFADYYHEGAQWITLADKGFYPDLIDDAVLLYRPVMEAFGKILEESKTSLELFWKIQEAEGHLRVQLWRVFRKYICPTISVEMLKIKSRGNAIVKAFGHKFRDIEDAKKGFNSRKNPDEILAVLLWEYKDRGRSGYDLTENFFELIRYSFPDFEIIGPERAGKDIILSDHLPDYPNKNRPVDFLMSFNKKIVVVGLAHYDSDRGGGQEDDRTGQYKNCAYEILTYANKTNLNIKIIFLNDGPGLLLGSMWRDYAEIEKNGDGKIMVLTMKMINERLSTEWLLA